MPASRGVFVAILATILTLAFFAFVGALFFLPVPDANMDMLMIASGVLFGGANMAWGYFFGSSSGSAKKTDALLAEVDPTRPEGM